MFDLNPIDVLKQREIKTLPPHFSKIKVSDSELFEGNIDSWIKNRLKGRYCIVRSPSIDNGGNLKSATFVGFEDQKELTYFMLACPHLRRN
jgi:hypothetical protein